MHFLTRVLLFCPRSILAQELIAVPVLLQLAFAQYVWGTRTLAVGILASALLYSWLIYLQLRARWQHREAIKLRNQVRRMLKRHLADLETIDLLVEADKTAVVVNRSRTSLGPHYIVVVATLDDEADLDWNLAFMQGSGLVRGQTFAFPAPLYYVEHEIWLDADNDALQDSQGDRDSILSHVRRLNMDAAIATVPELQTLLYLLHAGVPMDHPFDAA